MNPNFYILIIIMIILLIIVIIYKDTIYKFLETGSGKIYSTVSNVRINDFLFEKKKYTNDSNGFGYNIHEENTSKIERISKEKIDKILQEKTELKETFSLKNDRKIRNNCYLYFRSFKWRPKDKILLKNNNKYFIPEGLLKIGPNVEYEWTEDPEEDIIVDVYV